MIHTVVDAKHTLLTGIDKQTYSGGAGRIVMSGERFTIIKNYRVFQTDNPISKPMDDMTEARLCAWLRSRGFSENQTMHIVEQTDNAEAITITLP